MPLFAYKALAANGAVTTGELEAADRPEALRVLDKKGLQPVNLKETAAAAPSKKPAGGAKAKTEESAPSKSKTETEEKPIPDGPIKLSIRKLSLPA